MKVIPARTVEQALDVLALQTQEEIHEETQPLPRKRILERIDEQIGEALTPRKLVDILVQQIKEQLVEAVKSAPQKRVSERTVELSLRDEYKFGARNPAAVCVMLRCTQGRLDELSQTSHLIGVDCGKSLGAIRLSSELVARCAFGVAST